MCSRHVRGSGVLEGGWDGDGSLTLTAHATAFPNSGYRITRNGTVLRTRTFQNAACRKALGVAGFATLTTGLGPVGFLAGRVDVTTLAGQEPGEYVIPCEPRTPFVVFHGGQFGGAGSSSGW